MFITEFFLFWVPKKCKCILSKYFATVINKELSQV